MTFITVWLIIFFCTGCTGCGDGCKYCAGISKTCIECKNGYWLYNTMCKRCPENCTKCSSDIHCSKCKAGFYGTNCSQKCTLCKEGLCDIEDGRCITGCIDGYYEDSTHQIPICQKCSDNCKLCQSMGICLVCDNGFYELNYITEGGVQISLCLSCLPFCEECDTVSDCTVCTSGKYGPSCQYNCSDSHCYRCNKADDVEKCTECTTGYTIDENACVPEITCSPNCSKGCDESELCVGGCKDGWSGQSCTKKCASQCQKCHQDNNKVCTKCKEDFFTPSCNSPCYKHCSKGSPRETCRFHDGLCVNGCTDGYWGGTCNRTCNDGCNSAQCNRTNGFCASCYRSYYGSACQHTCSENCFDDSSINQVCRTSDGKCELGCISGYSGDRCEYLTRSTTTSPFTSGNTGTEISTYNSQLHQQECSETKFYVLGFASGVGFSMMVVAGVGLLCFLRRRHKFTPETTRTLETKEEKAYENTTIGMSALSSTETDYERLQGEKRDDQQQYTELGRPERN